MSNHWARVAELLGVKPEQVGIKAKTPEGLNLEHAALAHVVVLLMETRRTLRRTRSKKSPGKKR